MNLNLRGISSNSPVAHTHRQLRPHNPPADDGPQQHRPRHNVRHQETAADVLLHKVKPPRPLRSRKTKGRPGGKPARIIWPLEQPVAAGVTAPAAREQRVLQLQFLG